MNSKILSWKKFLMCFAICIFMVGSITPTADAKTSYTVKNQKLYHSKTKKIVKPMTVYKNKLYKNGTVYKKKTVFQKKLYVNGTVYKKKTVFQKKLYVNGIIYKKKTVFENKLYENGVLKKGRIVFQKKLYVNGVYKKDTVKPIITVGSYEKQVQNGNEFKMPKVSAKDEISGNLSVNTAIVNEYGEKVDEIDTKDEGIYKITYTAIDLEKNKATKTLQVEVLEAAVLEVLDVQ